MLITLVDKSNYGHFQRFVHQTGFLCNPRMCSNNVLSAIEIYCVLTSWADRLLLTLCIIQQYGCYNLNFVFTLYNPRYCSFNNNLKVIQFNFSHISNYPKMLHYNLFYKNYGEKEISHNFLLIIHFETIK